ncbi:MAG: peptidoglycan bridge formation glycyltransferase FemA/FemB family protein [Thermosynechococcaceae cyanobacterium]
MLHCQLLYPTDRSAWDWLTQQSPTGCFMQAWAWADFKEREGFQTFRYGLFQAERLVGGCCFYGYPQPHGANLLTAPGGPCLPSGQEAEGMALLLAQAQHLAQDFGAIALRIEPLWSMPPAWLQGFVRAPVDLLPSETLWIDLRPSAVDLLAAMKPKGRYNIRVSQRYGVETTFTCDAQAIPTFYDVFWDTAERQQFFGEPYGYFINLCQTLFAAHMAEIGLATWQGEVLAVMLLVYWGKQATYLYGGRTARHPEAMASYGLHWAALQRAKGKGCDRYDFYGYSRNPHHSYAKFSQFKGQFGGTVATTMGAHDYFFYDRLADTLVSVFNRLHLGEDSCPNP